ncbi:hypothetical protein GPALN_002172 [Globodera pallida]|uniref:Secreted salivary protein n=1 Tax=Globodera pallida TaxID=36090 RepID=A0A183BML5_GLOPA|nr:hypothetical protein GPALN_002172 [Globodera pallida]
MKAQNIIIFGVIVFLIGTVLLLNNSEAKKQQQSAGNRGIQPCLEECSDKYEKDQITKQQLQPCYHKCVVTGQKK